ncbi:threonine-phosphate decarboxylase [Enterococcus sp. 669A]|uniref:threonine-phosphate decarboxylase n=1 Tax=Candidatus Enterococcus moelleringii TaxID=2815325 RepID=A0ABS3LI06_9ENTE|nr:threonine-phosphate decarboxylase CobD [Enterococcus sp. 669A]MBO1308014.1 threonine-phosphate decarboxylase [Enterococcus sp. 669A]
MAKHGGNIQEIAEIHQLDPQKLIDFSANINPLGIPAGVKKVLQAGIEQLVHYPDLRYRDLKAAIAEFHGIRPEQVYASNGAAEAIFMLGKTLPVNRLLLLAPTFVEYEEAFSQQATEFCYFNLEKYDFQWNVADLIQSAKRQKVTGICLCNPNNPTGQLLRQDELLQLLAFCQDNEIKLIVDEAFVDFSEEDQSLVGALNDYSQLFIFRSLTKMFAIPGLRLGYLLTSNQEILAEMEQQTVPWHINTFADLAGQQALKEQEFIKESQQYIKQERAFLVEHLAKFAPAIKCYPSETNYLFFRYTKEDCLQERLLTKNILIRNCDSFKGLSQRYYRIAVKSRPENEALLAALEEIL